MMKEYTKQIPLVTRITVALQAHFLHEGGGTFFMPMDEEGNDIPEAVAKNKECFDKAQPIIDLVLGTINDWKQDGILNIDYDEEDVSEE